MVHSANASMTPKLTFLIQFQNTPPPKGYHIRASDCLVLKQHHHKRQIPTIPIDSEVEYHIGTEGDAR
ncbi:hypothetical protein TCAL_15832, partial [Tigriopus californicus]